MAVVLAMIKWPQRKEVVVLRSSPKVDPKILELQTAKEILAEIFGVRISDVEEMILSRYDDFRCEGAEELWPKEFQFGGGNLLFDSDLQAS